MIRLLFIFYKKVIRKAFRKKPITLFIPYQSFEEHCAVTHISKLIYSKISNRLTIVSTQDKLNDLLARSVFLYHHDKIIIYGHPNEQRSRLLTNEEEEQVSSYWFPNDNSFDFCLFMVCEGTRILNQKDWSKLFRHWVSFSDMVSLLFSNLPKIESVNRKLFLDLHLVIQLAPSEAIYDNLIEVFEEAIRYTIQYVSFEEAKVIQLLHLQRAMESLTFSRNIQQV